MNPKDIMPIATILTHPYASAGDEPRLGQLNYIPPGGTISSGILMRMQRGFGLGAAVLILCALASAAEAQAVASGTARYGCSPNVTWNYSLGSAYSVPTPWTQDWGFGYPFNFWRSPYSHLNDSLFPYLHFYDQATRRAEESRRAADEFEASLAREGKLTGPANVGAFVTDSLPSSPLRVTVVLNEVAQEPSSSGLPLVLESGEHTLHIPAKIPGRGDSQR